MLLAGIAAACSLVLGFVAVWQASIRRGAEAEVRECRATIDRLQKTMGDDRGPTTAGGAVEAKTPTSESIVAQRILPEAVSDETLSGLNDPITGLLGEDYFVLTLHARVAYARRHLRPLSLILLDVMEGVGADDQPSHANPVDIADIVATTLRDADTVCRLRQGRFGLILEDTNETGAIWTVERIRRQINVELAGCTVWAGVACYPAHGFDGPELFAKATTAIEAARDWFQDRTEVATGL